ncbi:hypothetical protein ACI78V_12135 [Geodermatophilus sp. SYSU D00742]
MRRAAAWPAAGAMTVVVVAGVVVPGWADTSGRVAHGGSHAPLVPDDSAR